MSPTIRLLLEYEGTPYVGWQRQAGRPSVQGELEAALYRVTGEGPGTLMTRCAGRTDAGVHAQGQVVAFSTASMREGRRFAPALNHYLPPSIRVQHSERAADDFDPRRDSVAKTYRYGLFVAANPSALLRHRAWHVRRRLDLAVLGAAAQQLVGEHDFESYRSVHCDAAHAVRRLTAIDVAEGEAWGAGRTVRITITGNAFCRHMCRIIVGTLVEVGASLRPIDDVARILAARDRRAAGETAPGHGLTLVRVAYP